MSDNPPDRIDVVANEYLWQLVKERDEAQRRVIHYAEYLGRHYKIPPAGIINEDGTISNVEINMAPQPQQTSEEDPFKTQILQFPGSSGKTN